jgi:NifB/MoaA-like Fe-S oxidoreductase
VGLTRHRRNLPDLDPVTPKIAADCIALVSEWQDRFGGRFGANFVYLGDEFYLLAGRDIPEAEYYDGFPLVENGVGMVRRFVDAFEQGFSRLEALALDPIRAILVTGVLGGGFLRPMVRRLNALPWLEARVLEVENRFLGRGITVSGLLTGQDILDSMRSDPQQADVVVLPPNCVSHTGILLDDVAPADLADDLGCEVVIGSYDLAETLAGLAKGRREGPRETGGSIANHPYISAHQLE